MLLLRHGQTTWNAEKRWQGWADAPLSPLGEQQARDAAAHLGDHGFTLVCSSDLERARRTAEILASLLGIGSEVVVEAGIRERDVGVFSGRTTPELQAAYPECFDPETGRTRSIPGAESDASLIERAVAALVALVDRFPDDQLLVVSHGGLIGTVERHIGIERRSSVPNLGGRWLDVDAGTLVGGDSFVPVEAELVTVPTSE